MRILASAAAVLVLTLAAGCGGDSGDEKTAEPRPTGSTSAAAPDSGGLTVTDGITPNDLVGCLTDAGLAAEVSDSVPFGVEVPVVNVDVTAMTDYSDGTDQGASSSSSPTGPAQPTTPQRSRWAAATTRPATASACTRTSSG